MFGCWRKIDAADPDTFITGVAAVLSDYPEGVVSRVTDPRTGLPGKQPFPPSPYEVKQACDAQMAPIIRQRERERRMAESQRLLLAPPDRPRPTIEELQERAGGRHWGISQGSAKAAPIQPREVLMNLSGMSPEEFAKAFDALPNSPKRVKDPA